jgi:hypothetical protein
MADMADDKGKQRREFELQVCTADYFFYCRSCGEFEEGRFGLAGVSICILCLGNSIGSDASVDVSGGDLIILLSLFIRLAFQDAKIDDLV